MTTVKSERPNGFSIGKLDGMTWGEVESRAEQLTPDTGDVAYRGFYICTVYNDDGGGDQVGSDGETMSDADVQAAISEIDANSIMELSERDGQIWSRPFHAPRSQPWRPVDINGVSFTRAADYLRSEGYTVTRRNSGL